MYNRLDRIAACDGRTDGRIRGVFSALGVSHVMRSINVRYLLTYLLTYLRTDRRTDILPRDSPRYT